MLASFSHFFSTFLFLASNSSKQESTFATGHEALLQRGVDEGKADAPILFGVYVNPTAARAIHCRTGNCSHPTSVEPSTPISSAPTFRMNGFRSHVELKSCGTRIRRFLQLRGLVEIFSHLRNVIVVIPISCHACHSRWHGWLRCGFL